MPSRDALRPDPEALLKTVTREGRGRLKLFLGAMPGVGKTYEMLLEAHDKKRDGVDVAIGVIEHHGRRETQSLIHGLEIVPRRRIEYRGQMQQEMDIDAILKRRPQLVLVDELAHTNVEGSRHPKRWMDVRELLAAGIDVFSTMNVQHLESANDVVAAITHVQVRETVPDSVLDLADDVELVDITPEELQARLKEGKVYSGEAAQRALANFFTPGNITALRELALRRTAERVDTAMRAHRAEHGVEGVWAASERVLAAIDASPASLNVVRRAKRLADRLRAPWFVAHVATADAERRSHAAQEDVLDAFRLAEELGAETRTLTGDDAADEILSFARDQNMTHIVIGSASRPLWIELFRGSIVRRLVRAAGDIAIEIAPREERGAAAVLRDVFHLPSFGQPSAYLVAAVWVALATGLAVFVDQVIGVDLPNISLVFVLAVIGAAIRSGLVVSVVTAIMAALAYNFFLIPPLYTFTIYDPSNVWAVIFFVAVALLTSGVAARARAQTMIARRQARQANDLQAFARDLVAADNRAEIGRITAETTAKLLYAHVVLLTPAGEELEPIGEAPGPEFLGAEDLAAAQWTWETRRAAGRGSDTLTGARWLFVPAPGEQGAAGVIGIRLEGEASRLDPEQRRLVDLIAAQAGVALDRARLAREAADARVQAEGERLKGVLLDSVGHDLRTPLSTVQSALESLERFGDKHDAATRAQLLGAARGEAQRLGRFVENLLDMTRIEAGAVRAKRVPVEVIELVDTAIDHANAALKQHTISRDISTGLPSVLADPVLAEAALANVLENAAKYAPPHSAVLIRAYRSDHHVSIEILDEGQGLPSEPETNIFGKFVRGVEGDGRPPGTGLGLAIAQGFLVAQGGSIVAENRTDRAGALIRIMLPLAET